MKRFFALVHKDENSAFGVQFPDFKGLFSAADQEKILLLMQQKLFNYIAKKWINCQLL
ncbi:HicB-like antitoxin of toxin-antitoxin system (plasmid) [Bartonella sp. WD12.1]|nr:HicB-like antitoxin of toxin-antitoxin system [Bartonella sp. WD12.1]